jgi:hypothetical protein
VFCFLKIPTGFCALEVCTSKHTKANFGGFYQNNGYVSEKTGSFDLLKIVALSPKNRTDNHQGSVPVFDSCPTPHALSKSGLGF